jgi:transcriptional regulator with XRE-family HTH domain
MPRKNPLPRKEADVCGRLKYFRERLNLSRVAFAKEAGIDSSLLVRYEHGRAPLRYAVGWRIIAAFGLNAAWIAEGEGRELLWIPIPSPEELNVGKEALFSEVYESHLKKLIESESSNVSVDYEKWKQTNPLAVLPDTKGRFVVEGVLRVRIRGILAAVPDARLNEFVQKLLTELYDLAREFPLDSAATQTRRLRAVELYEAAFEARKKMLARK